MPSAGQLPLAGCRVLVLEDEYYIAADLEAALSSAGAEVVGTIGELSKALEQVAHDAFDIAVVDINLRGESAYMIAHELQRLRIPFVFATVYGAKDIPARFRDVPVWRKPYEMKGLVADVARLCPRVRNRLGF
jgi:CheY-like chemotaxis protein